MARSRSKATSPDGRPRVQPRPYAWKDKDGTRTAGIALWARNGLAGHLTDVEARDLADQLHDLADNACTEPKLSTAQTERH